MVLFSYSLSIFKYTVFIYVCIRMLDFKVENPYKIYQRDKIEMKKKEDK